MSPGGICVRFNIFNLRSLLLDWGREADGALLVAEDHLADVGEAGLEAGPGAGLVHRLAQRLTWAGHAPPGAAGKVIPPSGPAPQHLGQAVIIMTGVCLCVLSLPFCLLFHFGIRTFY